jgi:monoamine oxidase
MANTSRSDRRRRRAGAAASTLTRRDVLQGAAVLAAGALLPRAVRAAPMLDVIVIGAGLSGLNAAILLEEQGLRVRVLEGRGRVGGRIESLRSVEGAPEMGGDSILGGYGRMQSMARRLGLKLVDHEGRRDLSPEAHLDPRSVELALGGQVIKRADWLQHPLNTMPADARDRFPGRGYFQSVIATHNPLANFEDWWRPESRPLDVSVYEFFRKLGWSDAAIELNYNTNVQYGTSAHDVSALMWFYVQAWFKLQGARDRVAYKAPGGNQSIPEAMAASLRGDVIKNAEVLALRSTGSGVEVRCADGSVHTARRVVCSMPLPTLRWLHFDPLLPPAKLRAIRTVPVMRITKVVLVPKRPFWREDGMAPAMWTDTAAGEIRALREADGHDDVTCLMAWARGFLADRLDAMGPQAAGERVRREYEALRPASKGQLEVAGVKSWQSDRYSGGDWVCWAPGQVTDAVPALKEPAGLIHFCGEHTALSNRGMEGAMESGERAALELLGSI